MEDGNAALQLYNSVEASLQELRHRVKDVVYDVTTTAGMEVARKDRRLCVTMRTTLEAARKEHKADLIRRGKQIDEEAKRIEGEIRAVEEPIDSIIKSEEERKEREKREAAEKEEKRRQAILDRLSGIAAIPTTAVGLNSAGLQDLIKNTMTLPITAEDFQEFLGRAESVREITLSQLRDMLFRVAEQEREAAEREERQKREAEEQERVRVEQERIAGLLKAERERLEAERAEQEAMLAKARAEAEAKLAADKAVQEALAAKLLEARAAFEAEKAEAERVKRETEEKVAREQAEAERLQAEQEAEERRIQEEKAAAEKAEAERIERERQEAEANRLRAEFEERLKNINFAMTHIWELCQDMKLDPWKTLAQISTIAEKFVMREGTHEIHQPRKSTRKLVQPACQGSV